MAQVAVIYRDPFTKNVVNSGDYERQRRALIEVHETLERTGLVRLLLNPEILDQGI